MMDNSREKIISMVMEEYDVIEEPVTENRPTPRAGTPLQEPDGKPEAMNWDIQMAMPDKEKNCGEADTAASTHSPVTDLQVNVDKSADELDKDSGSSEAEESKTMGKSLQEDDGVIYELLCPRVNCPEKIVICLDFSSEMDKPMFRTRAGDKFAPLKLVKRALGFYVHSKHRIDSRHEFALMILQDSAIWVKDFTRDARELVNLLEDLEDTTACETCDLSSVFQSVYERVVMPTVDGDPLVLPPPYIVRLLMIYGRSHCLMELPHKEAQRALFSSPYFFVDAFYIHETSSEENKCEEIFDSLCDLDYKGFSYIFEASRNPTKIYDFMAQMLAHPLQRPGQKDTAYKLKPRTAAEQ